MKARLMSCVKTVLCGLATAVFGLLPAQAENYYLSESASGVAADFGDPATYGRESGLPGSGDQIYVNDNLVLKVTDANVASLSARGTTVYCTTKAKVEIDLAGNAELKAQFTYSGSSECAGVTKTGAGTLTLTLIDNPTYDTSGRYVGCKNRWHVLGGTLVFPQTKISATSTIDLLDIGAGCTVVSINGYVIYAQLAGQGNLEYRAADSTRIAIESARAGYHGNILQAANAGTVQIYVNSGAMLYGAEGTAYTAPYITGGPVGLGRFGMSGSPATLGTSGKFNLSSDAHFLALGTTEETSDKQFVLGSAVSTVEVDGGAFGGVTFTGAWNPTGEIMRSLILSGSNTEHACVLRNTIADVGTGADTCSYHLVKKGTGVWRMASANPKWSGAMTIEEGTLKFDTIAPAGTACSLGFATNLYANVPGTKDEANRVDWAVKLGNPGVGEVATLEYAGTAAAEWPTSRPIVVDGRGRFRNETGSAFTLAGVTAATAGSSLSLDGDAASGNKLTGVSDGAGTLKIVKEGAGDWSVSGAIDVSDGVDVRAGTLEVQNRTNFNWFKVIVKETFVSQYPDAATARVKLQEFALYDVNGVRQNLDPVIGEPQVGGAAGTLAPGGLAYGPCPSRSTRQSDLDTEEPLINMTKANTTNSWCYPSSLVPDPENENTWVSFIVRVPEGTPEIKTFDLRFYAKVDTYAKNHYSPRIVEIRGGTDGLEWTSLVTVTNRALETSYYNWLYGDQARYSDERDPANSGMAFARRAVADVQSVFISGNIAVADDALFAVRGNPLEISRLELDFAAGIGSFDNLRLASSGTIVVKNVPKGAVTIPADFTGVGNLEAAGDWTVVDEFGRPFKRKVVIAPTSVSVLANGLMLILR